MFVRRLEALFSDSHAEFIARGNVFFTVTLFDRHPEIYWNKKIKKNTVELNELHWTKVGKKLQSYKRAVLKEELMK